MINRLLQIFAKAPIQGFVKTRLIAELGDKKATDVYIELLDRTINLALTSEYKTQIWCAPNQQHDFFQFNKQKYGVILKDQLGRGLGERMQYALRQGLKEADEVMLIGADCPVFTTEYLVKAFEALRLSDVVLGPAEDGGFVLVGCRKTHEKMFDGVNWGHSTVLEQTVDAITKAGLTSQLLPMLWDVDTLADLKRWRND
ncbi:MAG: TIGR04282 family arsenosugar biosynthesis glycosyltransferase [Cycloclasticus sp.]|jgi:rSAM/selenodomain-associated transferase 1|nr:TIGR04282 family arsenosugar biosynthesis glycosyltransferase [Cycloclasticus sp.]